MKHSNYNQRLSSAEPADEDLDGFLNESEDNQIKFLKNNFNWQILLNLYTHNSEKLIDLLSRDPTLLDYANNKKSPKAVMLKLVKKLCQSDIDNCKILLKSVLVNLYSILESEKDYIAIINIEEALPKAEQLYNMSELIKKNQIECLYKAKKYEEAISVLRELEPLQRPYEIKELHGIIIESYLQNKDSIKAIEYYYDMQQEEEKPYSEMEMHEKYTNCLLSEKKYSECISHCNALRNQFPNLEDTLFNACNLFVTDTLENHKENMEHLESAKSIANKLKRANKLGADCLFALIEIESANYKKAYEHYLNAMSSQNEKMLETARIGLVKLFLGDKIMFCKQLDGKWQLEANISFSPKEEMTTEKKEPQKNNIISRAIQAYGFIVNAQSKEGLELKRQIIATILGQSMDSNLTDNELYEQMNSSCCLAFTEFYGNFTNIPYSQEIYHKALIKLPAKQQGEITRLSAENKLLKEEAIKLQEANKALLAKLEKLTNNNSDIAWKPQASKTFRNSL